MSVRTTFHNLVGRVAAGARPEYVVTFTGPEHARVYTAIVKINGIEHGRGVGRSADEAKDNAASAALQTLRR